MYRVLLRCFLFLLFACMLCLPLYTIAATFEISGVNGGAAENIRTRVDLLRLGDDDVPRWQRDQLARQAPEQIREALKPFGYYQADARVEVTYSDGAQSDAGQNESGQHGTEQDRGSTSEPHYRIIVMPGPPVRVRQVTIDIEAPDDKAPAVFSRWRDDWPLPEQAVLDQRQYTQSKRKLERLAEQHGFFRFHWTTQEIKISRDLLHADITLRFFTGRQAVFGQVDLGQKYFTPRLMARFVGIRAGQPYALERVEQLRNDLSASGYFHSVAIVEDVDRSQSPPVVHLRAQLKRRPPNTYTTTLGFGTDTGPRLQLGWQRHYLGRHGDRANLALGGQQQNKEFVLRGNYERPRGNDPGEFWFTQLVALREEEDFRFETSGSDEQIFPELDGNQRRLQVDAGLLTEIGRDSGWPIDQRWFVSYLNDRFDALDRGDLSPEQQALLNANPQLEPNLEISQNVVALGASWDLRQIIGSGFGIHGTRAQLRLAGAVAGIGSEISFAQLYLGVRHNRLLGDNHKVLLRGEVGYTAAPTRDFTATLDDRSLDLSISRLPEAYRFKTGGDRAVRGYGFESLSNNRIGSNHLITLSAEYEYRIAKDWSLAAFYDAGNAFNRYSDLRLRQGVGVGVRWYSLVGPVRLDFAHGLDEPSAELRLHITLGSPLL